MTDRTALVRELSTANEQGVAAVGTLASIAALFSAAACCVLPLALAALGIGAGGLAGFVPFRWPLTIGAALAVAVGWGLYARKRRACAADVSCTAAPPARTTVVMLSIASLSVALSALWGFIEQPLMRALGGA